MKQRVLLPIIINEIRSEVTLEACSVCQQSFGGSTFLLALHLEEQHSAMFISRVERGESMYQCLVPNCQFVGNTKTARYRHLREAHAYPSTFRFPSSPPIYCRYFLKGNCKNGPKCRFKHQVWWIGCLTWSSRCIQAAFNIVIFEEHREQCFE